MPIDDLFNRLVRRFRHSQDQESGSSQGDEQPDTYSRGPKGGQHGHGFFSNSRHFVVNHPYVKNHPTFIENQVIMAGKPILNPVLENILPYTDLSATVDSNARFPPPLCHPGTRLKIRARLDVWLANIDRRWDMIWLHGPAGTGKSAVAQSFAEQCFKIGRLGASFFFSRPNQRNNPDTVVPTLVYQLAVHNQNFKSLVAARLAEDPGLMQKARHIQFNKLIIEPLSQLQEQKRKRIQEPLLVVLDGLDECKGEDAQRELIGMISEATQLKKDLPLLWLICSRSEAHLKYIFSRAEYTIHCGREELVIDVESIADVDLYIQDGLAGIRSHFEDVTTSTWPSQNQITELLEKASGHFGFASTALRYIGDATFADPIAQLDQLLSFLAGVRADTAKSPLEALDTLYAGILRDVPDRVLPSVKRILAFYCFISPDIEPPTSVLFPCNLFCINQATFYSSFRKLHSVIDIPAPGAALQTNLRFYHASFNDYLQNPHRSGKFITKGDAWLDFTESCLSWYKTDLEFFHTTDGYKFNQRHEHGVLPGLKWVSEDTAADVSSKIAYEAAFRCWWASCQVTEWGDTLLAQFRDFDFRYIWQDNLDWTWMGFVNKLWEVDSPSGFIRTEPQSETDLQLLEYMIVMARSGKRVKPAKFPLKNRRCYGQYFLLGNGSTAVVCWSTGLHVPWFVIQSRDEVPSKERVDAYRALFDGKNVLYDSDYLD